MLTNMQKMGVGSTEKSSSSVKFGLRILLSISDSRELLNKSFPFLIAMGEQSPVTKETQNFWRWYVAYNYKQSLCLAGCQHNTHLQKGL